jgi:hypothetical protein
LLGHIPKEYKSRYNGDSSDEWIKKIWDTNTMECYSAIKKIESMLFAGKWMKLENIMLSDIARF